MEHGSVTLVLRSPLWCGSHQESRGGTGTPCFKCVKTERGCGRCCLSHYTACGRCLVPSRDLPRHTLRIEMLGFSPHVLSQDSQMFFHLIQVSLEATWCFSRGFFLQQQACAQPPSRPGHVQVTSWFCKLRLADLKKAGLHNLSCT